MNKIILSGNTAGTPLLKTFDNGNKIVTLSLATNHYFKDAKGEKVEKTTWHNLIFFNKYADVIIKHCQESRKLLISGNVEIDHYEKDEIKRIAYKVNVESMEFI